MRLRTAGGLQENESLRATKSPDRVRYEGCGGRVSSNTHCIYEVL